MSVRKYRYLEEFFDPSTGISLGEGVSPKKIKTSFGEKVLHKVARVTYTVKQGKSGRYLTVQKTEEGGWIESYDNLSQAGDCWVKENAVVCGDAFVSGNAVVGGSAEIGDSARVTGDATIDGEAVVEGNCYVGGTAKVSGNAVLSERAMVLGKVFGNAKVSGAARVLSDAEVGGNARVGGRVILTGKMGDNSLATSYAYIAGEVKDDAYVVGDAFIFEGGRIQDEAVSEGGFVFGKVEGEAIVGSRQTDIGIIAVVKPMSMAEVSEFYYRRKPYYATAEDYRENLRNLMQVVWDKDSGEQDNCGNHWVNISSIPDLKDYDPREDEWVKRKLDYEENKGLADSNGFEPDYFGYVYIPCYETADGEIKPITAEMRLLRDRIFGSRYGRLCAGASPVIWGEGRLTDKSIAEGVVILKGRMADSSFVGGNIKLEGRIAEDYNVVLGNSVVRGKVGGKAVMVGVSVVDGRLDGDLKPGITTDGNDENFFSYSYLGEPGIAVGKFDIQRAFIEGIVAGTIKYKETEKGDEKLVLINSRYYSGIGDTPTHMLEGEKMIADKMKLKYLEKNGKRWEVKEKDTLLTSIPNVYTRFTDSDFGFFEGIGYYKTLEHYKETLDRYNDSMEEECKRRNDEIERNERALAEETKRKT